VHVSTFYTARRVMRLRGRDTHLLKSIFVWFNSGQ
jgi:hypothetical protein